MVNISINGFIPSFYPEVWEWCFWKTVDSEAQTCLLINILMADHLALLPKLTSRNMLICELLEPMLSGDWFPGKCHTHYVNVSILNGRFTPEGLLYVNEVDGTSKPGPDASNRKERTWEPISILWTSPCILASLTVVWREVWFCQDFTTLFMILYLSQTFIASLGWKGKIICAILIYHYLKTVGMHKNHLCICGFTISVLTIVVLQFLF